MWSWVFPFIKEGLVSVISAVVMFPLGFFWKSFVRPSLERIGYKGIRLAPVYSTEFILDGNKVHETVELKQRAYRVWGRITSPESPKGSMISLFEGTLDDSTLRGIYNGTSKSLPAHGSFLLTRSADSKEWEGFFVEPWQKTVVSLKYTWIPRNS